MNPESTSPPDQDAAEPTVQATPVRLLLVDDHTIVREGLKRILDGSGDGWTIAEAGSGFQALP